jgi:hypothetical protein
MSRENVEIARELMDVVVRRDTEAAVPYLDPEAEFQSAIIRAAEGITYRGHQGFRDWMGESAAAFEELRARTVASMAAEHGLIRAEE